MNHFQTILTSTDSLYKEKGSKFLGFAFPVRSEEEVKAQLEQLKSTYYDARHHCYAYIIGLKDQSFRANDDGEPNHSAGDPILGQIRSKELTNCLVVVVRYFGGTKLGVGGLINSYKSTAEEALNQAQIISIYSKTKFHLHFTYGQTSEVERILNEYVIDYLDKSYTDTCDFTCLIKDEDYASLASKLELVQVYSIQKTD